VEDLYDKAPAWLVPQLYFGVNWDEHDQRLKPQSDSGSWEDYPVMPMLLPDTDLFLRFCVVHAEPKNPFSRRLMLLLRSRSGSGVPSRQAWDVSGAVMGLLALANMLMVDPRDAEPIPIPPSFMPALEVERPALLDNLNLTHAVGNPTWVGITEVASIGSRWDQLMLLLPALTTDRDLWRGAQYLIASLRVFTFMGDDMRDTFRDREALPDSPYVVVDTETAVWLAYKAVESVVGDPPSDRRKLQRRLDELKLMDFPGVWRDEAPFDLVERVTDFVGSRDRRAAHGRHHPRRRPFTYYEVMDYQYLARSLLVHYAEKVLDRLQLARPSF
jgi:hypothetical protein